VLWLAIGGGLAMLALVRGPARVARSAAVTADDRMPAVPAVPDGVVLSRAAGWRASHLARLSQVAAVSGYVARWMLRDTGWRVLALLGVANVAVHSFLDVRAAPADPTGAALGALQQHARLFLILLATIYAGELVWREREERSAPFFDALPLRDEVLVFGRVWGVLLAQVSLVALLTLSAALAGTLASRGAVPMQAGLARAAVVTLLVPFVVWMLLSLAVHVVVQQKVVGHLLCIAGWVLAILMSRVAASPAGGDHPGGWWVVAGVGAAVVAWLGWVRGEPVAMTARLAVARHRVEEA
jgi:hypothetical protein